MSAFDLVKAIDELQKQGEADFLKKRRLSIATKILSSLITGHLSSPNQDKIHPEDLVRESLLITDTLIEWSEKDPTELPKEILKADG